MKTFKSVFWDFTAPRNFFRAEKSQACVHAACPHMLTATFKHWIGLLKHAAGHCASTCKEWTGNPPSVFS